MEENNKTFIVKDEHIKSAMEVFKKFYAEKKESFDKEGITPENMEKILEVFSGKNAPLVKCCICLIAEILPIEELETIIEALQSMLEAKLTAELVEKIKEKMGKSKS